MSDIDIPTYRDLMYPTLVAVERLGGSAAISELDEEVVAVAQLTEDQLSVEYPEDATATGSKVVHRLHWARSYLKAIGALDNSERGVWSLTPSGVGYLKLDAAKADEALRAADNAVRTEWRKARKAKQSASAELEGPNEHGDDDDVEQGEPTEWRDALLSRLKAMDPIAFERLALRLLREAGFTNLEVTDLGGDDGIDGVGVYKPSLISFPIYFQCKRYKGNVGPSVVRDFRGAMAGRGEKGIIISTGTFSPSAKKEATRDGAPPIDLIDGHELCSLLKQYRLGVTVELVEQVTIVGEFFDGV